MVIVWLSGRNLFKRNREVERCSMVFGTFKFEFAAHEFYELA